MTQGCSQAYVLAYWPETPRHHAWWVLSTSLLILPLCPLSPGPGPARPLIDYLVLVLGAATRPVASLLYFSLLWLVSDELPLSTVEQVRLLCVFLVGVYVVF